MATTRLWTNRKKKANPVGLNEIGRVASALPAIAVSSETKSLPTGDNYRIVLNKDTTIKGKLSFEGPIRVDGRVDGELYATESLIIGKSACLKADVSADTLVIYGVVEGKINARKLLQVANGARLKGKISAPQIVVEDGAILINCSCKITQAN